MTTFEDDRYVKKYVVPRTKKYVRITGSAIPTESFRGIKVTLWNFINVADWCRSPAAISKNKRNEVIKHRIRVYTRKGIRAAHVGDYVLKDEDGKFLVVKKEKFDNLYKLG